MKGIYGLMSDHCSPAKPVPLLLSEVSGLDQCPSENSSSPHTERLFCPQVSVPLPGAPARRILWTLAFAAPDLRRAPGSLAPGTPTSLTHSRLAAHALPKASRAQMRWMPEVTGG